MIEEREGVVQPGFEQQLTKQLSAHNTRGGYTLSLVCTEQGLLMASNGDRERCEQAAGLTSLFDDILIRSVRDLNVRRVDELTLLDAEGERYIIRPLPLDHQSRLFVVIAAPRQCRWRRNTNQLVRALTKTLEPWMQSADPYKDEPEPRGKNHAG